MSGYTRRRMLRMWAATAMVAAFAVAALAGIGEVGRSMGGLELAELKTIIVAPSPPPPVDSGTVDLRDKKGPLIPHIPGTAWVRGLEGRSVARASGGPRDVFNPVPEAGWGEGKGLAAADPVKEGQERGQRELEDFLTTAPRHA